MKTNMQKYPAYKDSGVEWLGEIPSGWSEIKIKINSTIYNGDSLNENKKAKYESDDETHLAYISSKDIDLDTSIINYENGLRIPRNEPKYKVAKINSSLICIEGGSAGRKIAFTNQDVCFVNKLACVSAKNNFNSKFLYYTLKGSLFQTQFKLAMSGMIGGVAISSINNFYILIPPLPEQTAIAAFLDRKTTLIDQAIGIKQKQIELLKERRQILIHNAVTRGLNPNVKMKDSGVEWIGEIPEGWEVVKLKYLTEFINDGTHGSFSRVEEGYRLLSVRNMVDDKFVFREDDSRVSEKHFKEISSKFQIRQGDINLAIVGATLGKVAIVDEYDELFVTQRSVSTIRVKEGLLLNSFLFYSIKSPSFQSYLWNNAGFSAQPGVYLGTIQLSILSIPKIDEQKVIVDSLNETCLKYATAISLKEQEIEKLKEYKATLINSAVTGKIKVS